MSSPTVDRAADHRWHGTHGWRVLLMLGVACASFVAVVFVVMAPPHQPPAAALAGAAEAVAAAADSTPSP
jgi:hypothetical protein